MDIMAQPILIIQKAANGREYARAMWRDLSGRRRSKGLGRYVTKETAIVAFDSFLQEWERSPEMQQPRAAGQNHWCTVDELVARYEEWADGYYRRQDGTQTGHAAVVHYAVSEFGELFGQMNSADITSVQIEQYQGKMVARNSKCRSTINRNVAIVRQMFRWGGAKRIVPASVFSEASLVTSLQKGRSKAREGRGVRSVHSSVIEATISHLPATLAAMVRLQELTGMRPAEVCLMRGCDIDTTGRIWVYEPRWHKTQHHGHRRRIAIGRKAQEILRPFLARDLTSCLFRPDDAVQQRRGKRPKSRVGSTWTSHSYRQAIHYACDRAEVERWSPNQLRHTAEQRIEREFGVDTARKVLGHQSLQATRFYRDQDEFETVLMVMERTG